MLVMSEVVTQHRHLSATDTGTHIGEAIVVPDGGMVVVGIGITRLGGIPHDFRRICLRAADQCSSARGGDHLISIEGEDAKFPEGSQHLAIKAGAHTLSSILHHGDTVLIRYRHDLIDPVGHTIERYGDDRLRVTPGLLLTVKDRPLQQSRIHIPGLPLRADKDRLGTQVGDRVRGGAEGEALHQHLVAGTHTAADQRQVNRCCTCRQADHMPIQWSRVVRLAVDKRL